MDEMPDAMGIHSGIVVQRYDIPSIRFPYPGIDPPGKTAIFVILKDMDAGK
jgi:hypothetical protein